MAASYSKGDLDPRQENAEIASMRKKTKTEFQRVGRTKLKEKTTVYTEKITYSHP